MKSRGMNHIGLMTHDIEKTVSFYQDVLGFEPMAYYLREVAGGSLRQVFFDLGNGQSLEFAQAHSVEGIADDFDTGINNGLGVGTSLGIGAIHFAFDADSLEELDARKATLEAAGYPVLGPIDLDWMQSIYFVDPNGIQLEFACTIREVPGHAYFEPTRTEQWSELAATAAVGA